MAAISFVSFTDAVTGMPIDINPADVNIDACEAVPTHQLPDGVANATKVWVRGVVHVVSGTLAATVTALTTGAALLPAVKCAGDAGIISKNAGILAVVHTGTGVYTAQLAVAAAANSLACLATALGPGIVADADQTDTTHVRVRTYDAAGGGAAIDASFQLVCVPGLA